MDPQGRDVWEDVKGYWILDMHVRDSDIVGAFAIIDPERQAVKEQEGYDARVVAAREGNRRAVEVRKK